MIWGETELKTQNEIKNIKWYTHSAQYYIVPDFQQAEFQKAEDQDTGFLPSVFRQMKPTPRSAW